MKKYFVLASALVVVALINTSCDKEGVYNPKEKISKVYVDNGDEAGKELYQTWTWDDKLLSKIDNSMMETKDVLEYNKNNQLVKVTSYEESVETGYTTLTYDKSNLTSMDIYTDGKKSVSIAVEHDGKKSLNLQQLLLRKILLKQTCKKALIVLNYLSI
jgi:hypothetical protein